MLWLTNTIAISSQTQTPISIPSISKSLPILPLITNPKPPSPTLKFQSHTNPKKPRKFTIYAENGNGPSTDPNEEKEKKVDEGNKKNNGGDGGDGGGESNGRPRFNVRWADLVLDPDPDNIVAVGLTGLLAWATAQVLWQLFFISLAILFAALKYSFIAALLIFIFITLI